MKKNRKAIIGIILAIIVFIIFFVMPTPDGLSVIGKRALGLLLAGIILWVSEAFPIFITAFILMVSMPYLGILPLGEIWTAFISPVIFFALAAFGITAALSKTNIPNRIANLILGWSKNSPKKLIMGFMLATALISSLMSDVAACAIFMGLAISILKANGNPKPGSSNLGKALMIGIPAASMLGGVATPAGSSINIMAINMLEKTSNISISFVQWMTIGIPICLIMTILFAIWLPIVFKPEKVTSEAIATVKHQLEEVGGLKPFDIKVIILISLMFICWIASTWVPVLNVTIVAMVGLILMFFPGIDILTKEDFMRSCSWEIILVVGGVQVLAAGMLASGAANWFVDTAMSGASQWPIFLILLVVAIIGAILHILIPAAPAILGIALVPLVALGTAAGIHPIVITFILTFWAECEFLLPIDCIPLLTYGQGYYNMSDMLRSGIVPTILFIVLISLWVPMICGIIL